LDNVRTVFANLPTTVGAYTVCKDGFYTIVLNQNFNFEKNALSYIHELNHIQNGDFEKKCSADLIEFYTHKGE